MIQSNACSSILRSSLCKGPQIPLKEVLAGTQTEPFKSAYSYKSWNHLKNYPLEPCQWSHITEKHLPSTPQDIKGVPNDVYSYLRQKSLSKKLPIVVKNKFFVLKFFPSYHHISKARKSNVAYTFNNFGGHNLNDRQLWQSFKNYKGPYQKLQYFQTTPHPKNTAFERGRFRKLIRNSLFSAIRKLCTDNPLDTSLVSGIWNFRFEQSPYTTEDKTFIEKDMEKAVKLVTSSASLQSELRKALQLQNSDFNNGSSFLHTLSLENFTDAKNTLGYYPKLPYIKDE